MKKSLLLALFFATITVYCQNKYQQGYFISNTGTKTQCFIKNEGWKNNPENFSYTLTENGEKKTAGINSVAEFAVGDAYKFRRFITNIDMSSEALNMLSTDRQPQWQKDTLYLRSLTEGKLNLYSYEGHAIIRYFYSENDGADAVQLVYKKYMVNNNSIAVNAEFRQQLYILMKDKIANADRFEKTSYTRQQLVKLFTEYNGNGSSTKNYTAKTTTGNFNFKITLGAGQTSFKTKLAERDSPDFGTKTVFTAGIEAEYIFPFNNNKWGVFINPNYQYFEGSAKTVLSDWDVNLKFLEIPIGVRYYFFLNDKSRLFINGAYGLNINLGSQLVSEDGETDIGNRSDLSAGAGYSTGRFSAEIRCTFAHNVLGYYIYYSSAYQSTNLLVAYKLF